MKKIILEGCNGDWAQKRYLPLLAQKALENELDLTAVDITPEPLNVTCEQWNKARSQDKARFLQKDAFNKQYEAIIDVHRVFIVTPDKYHCETVDFWLPRLAPDGRIFVEKPLDASSESATALKIKHKGIEKTVYAFDHYLARTAPFLSEKKKYLPEIGDIKKIECRILEPYPIEPGRVKTMEKGVIFDLFSHILPIVACISDSLNPESIAGIRPSLVRFARYTGCPIPGESFALTGFTINGITVSSVVGYCVTSENNKTMVIHGTRGKIELNFTKDRFSTLQNQDSGVGDLQKRHVESFLESALQDDIPPLMETGVMDFNTALEILRFLERCKGNNDTMPDYPCGASLDDIL
ncbi:hypothetical protein ACFLYQ_01230 [Chloroflexota bacterium]